jgi:hypothetical protein
LRAEHRKRGKENTWRVLVANSTPMVDLDSRQNSFLVNLERILDLPTPESPISTILNR